MTGILKKIETEFIVEFDSAEDASIVYNSILPEIEAETNERSRTNLTLDSKKLVINIISKDIVSLRASINSYVRWINLSEKILKI
ncbi:KEOPS complex subunit Pcc1 [Methanosphaera sp. BMS]|uniref:KEOPS complex subunit Pcc1 n=1 Tax=Methanosphaera sp. BMS TaxID=1789762 RepID=UPI000DC1EF89|nr:KEOPS complex subunit Pcc1 [Methanosphaera sp. BMS]AWX33292.1 hypothetical protein AW729_09400 [Methanosphaera sp. BMS]